MLILLSFVIFKHKQTLIFSKSSGVWVPLCGVGLRSLSGLKAFENETKVYPLARRRELAQLTLSCANWPRMFFFTCNKPVLKLLT